MNQKRSFGDLQSRKILIDDPANQLFGRRVAHVGNFHSVTIALYFASMQFSAVQKWIHGVDRPVFYPSYHLASPPQKVSRGHQTPD